MSKSIKNAEFGSSLCFVKGGRGQQIDFMTQKTVFGWMIVGATRCGVCWLALADTKAAVEATLREEFPQAALQRVPSLAGMADAALEIVFGPAKSSELVAPQVPLDLRGTAFQLRVWQALCGIPRGETRSYSQLARELGKPSATRAVARACAANRVALVVPCHRVVGAGGELSGYRWGVERKRMLLEAEAEAPKPRR
jgi:AraC family transcriptional regulator, regulatory protein of adaptative response / methylated-DNA-[protein]-cysteine methyltransferase